jgi:cytochrome P450
MECVQQCVFGLSQEEIGTLQFDKNGGSTQLKIGMFLRLNFT